MAVQNEISIVVYPELRVEASIEQMSQYLLGVGNVIVDLPMHQREVLECGALMYREGIESFKVIGFSDTIIENDYLKEYLPSDLVAAAIEMDAAGFEIWFEDQFVTTIH